ncbi:hypothetical protein B0H14DRAFT_3426507 [Mycena olivaceomarginata]|nr:hypothetical protein B0H14DRAFT_3426507 [Mycena olivaceomarginata]
MDEWNAIYRSLGLQILQTSSDIRSCVIEVSTWSLWPKNCLQTFDEIFASLTLESIRDLSFTASETWVILGRPAAASPAIPRSLRTLVIPYPSAVPETVPFPHVEEIIPAGARTVYCSAFRPHRRFMIQARGFHHQ